VEEENQSGEGDHGGRGVKKSGVAERTILRLGCKLLCAKRRFPDGNVAREGEKRVEESKD